MFHIHPLFGRGDNYDPSANLYFSAMSVQPNESRKKLINDLITGLKNDGTWVLIDWLCLMATHSEQAARINMVNPSKMLTVNNNPLLTVDRGVKAENSSGNSQSPYILPEGDLASGVSATSTSRHTGFWDTNHTSGGSYIMYENGTNKYIYTYTSGNDGEYSIYYSSQFYPAYQAMGHRFISYNGSQVSYYFNGVKGTTASQATPITGGTSRQIGNSDLMKIWHQGANMTDAQISSLYSRLGTYLTAIGAN